MNNYQIEQKDIDLLRAQGMVDSDIAHSIHVAKKALDIAMRTGAELDMELVGRGALFHDLGKTVTHEIRHGLIGAEKGAAIGLPPEINAIMEKHIRGGLTESEAVELGLPVKDYTLRRLEERIIIYADRLIDIIHDGIIKLNNEIDAEVHFKEILRDNIKYGKNDITRERYYGYHDEIQGLISGAIIDAPRQETEDIEKTMACTAFAEAGEPCPIGQNTTNAGKDISPKKITDTIENDFACSAFYDQNEECPIIKTENK